ncbi:bifunctional glutamate--cysteine ligase GshA/glutathione synthetase GshB [Paenibacillus tianjinensis]|uniref:Glutathione biosynthesis bifunctional protein GshAB n=1 Tax=Paenibacillus tianjinensis TaxID=2810347 RepID=A0ABX7LKK2_9BACL|nr:bifunctional glutamate--cysteine ligase GshA/glutathione synthetase GshB [Paenibacillus tianjinensis]QSF47428.1 bifunctional glutamate--cysteine ligase GshA/glutathione synthetase GshB [Paenibacillus tianjinensis]
MVKLNPEFLNYIIDNNLTQDILKGQFGLEKENTRVDKRGNLALTPHPKAFGSKMDHPYIKTDFSESQVEMITPVFRTIEETYHFLDALQDIVTLELGDEYLWTSSNPPALPHEEDIPVARMNDPFEDAYREKLARKYGKKKQLLSGIHFNFSFDEDFLQRLYHASQSHGGFKQFKDGVYLKVARNILKYRWLLIYLTGASPVFNKSYVEQCVSLSDQLDDESHFFPNMSSLRNSVCGYRNEKPLYVSFQSIDEYVRDLRDLVLSKELLSAKEFYSPIRLKPAKGEHPLQELQDHGVAYIELRMFDLNPLFKNGIALQTLKFVHLFLVYLLLKQDEPFTQQEQQQADLNVDVLLMTGLHGELRDKGLSIIDEMLKMNKSLQPDDQAMVQYLKEQKNILMNPELSYASVIKAEIQASSYLDYHLDRAKQYAEESSGAGYKFTGYEDLELSTQLLLKAAVKRGIRFELIDRDDNFVVLTKGDHQEYVKQATKTALDSYSTVLIMENKIVTKEVLKHHGIRVPAGKAYQSPQEAIKDYELHRERKIVIKPKSTNFGLGITIFPHSFTEEDYQQAVEMAFAHDRTILLEEFISGKEYRFLVMGDEVVGILHRVPANVVGDGIQTIEQLVSQKNKDPLRGRGYRTSLERIQLGEAEKLFLRNQSLNTFDIPRPGEIIYLRENSNISTGGDSIDYTDDIPESYKQLAIRAAKAAGATFCGVDMMIGDSNVEANEDNYGIIEINFNPAIHIHCYPYQGKNRRADDKILDLLFGPVYMQSLL